MSMMFGIAYDAWAVKAHGKSGVVVAMIVVAVLEVTNFLVEFHMGEPIVGLAFNAIRGLF